MVTRLPHFGLPFSVLVSSLKNLPLLASSLKLLPSVLSLACMLTGPFFFIPPYLLQHSRMGCPCTLMCCPFINHSVALEVASPSFVQLSEMMLRHQHSFCTSLQDKLSPIWSDPHLYLLFNINGAVVYRSEFCFVICPVICWTENQTGVWHAGHVQVLWDGQSCACDVVECMTQFCKLWKIDVCLSCYL
jgi:hypothetical protein